MNSIAPFGIYFLDVGQGDCSFVCPPGSAPILVDCADAVVAGRFIKDHSKITELAAVIVSHLDDDHIHGMLAFLKDFIASGGKVKTLYLAIERPTLAGRANELISQAIRWEEEGLLTLCSPTRTVEPCAVSSGPNWGVDIILPWYGQQLQAQQLGVHRPNTLSAVIRVSFYDRVIIIGADAPLASWERLAPDLLLAHVFRTPHHGGDISEGTSKMTMADLYRKVAPEVAIFSVGTTNPYRHPFPQHMADAAAGGSCRRLCTQLTRQCHPHPEELKDASVMHDGVAYSYLRYLKPREVPCAGSVVIMVDAAGNIETEPASSQHDAFIDQMKHPLCRRSPS